MNFGFEFARSQAIEIAKDRVQHLTEEHKSQSLKLIDLVLEKWKLEQMGPDGKIAIMPSMIGLLGYEISGGITLGEMLEDRSKPKHIPASELQPEQCAGPYIRSKAELFAKLWSEEYQPAFRIAELPGMGLDIVQALLVEREGKSMPADSLASAIRYIWIYTWSHAKTFRKLLTEREAALADAKAAKAARARAGKAEIAKRVREAGKDKATQCRVAAIDYYRKHPDKGRDEMARFVAERLFISTGTVKRYSAGTKKQARTLG
jgi:hypothetical protein